METDRLRAFCTIVESGSMTRAAEVLGVSHSGLSKAIAKLQDELGFKVFRTSGRGLEPTSEGKDIYNRSRKILELVNELKRPATAGTEVGLRIVVPEVLALALGADFSLEFEQLTLEEHDSGELELKVAERQYDFGFTFVPFPRTEIEHLKIANVTLRSFQLHGAFGGSNPDSIPYVIPSSELKDNPLSLKIRDGWNHQLPRRIGFRTNSLSIALEMVKSGTCAIYAPDIVIDKTNLSLTAKDRLEKIPFSAKRAKEELTRRDIFLIKRKNEEETKLMKKAVRIIRKATSNA